MSQDPGSQQPRPPVWGMVLVALVLVLAVVGYFFRY